MSDTLTSSEYKLLKKFMKTPDEPLPAELIDRICPHNSEKRISLVSLFDKKILKATSYHIDESEKNIIDLYSVTRDGRLIYKSHKEYLSQKRKDFLANKSIDFCALIISILALIKSYETEIASLLNWCKQLIEPLLKQ